MTLLGRGFGESVVMHVGDRQWIVIDSLLDQDRMSAPLSYLKGIGVKSDQVKLVLASHWHDDHVAGISQLFKWASTAIIAMPIVKTGKEFMAYVHANSGVSVGKVTSGVSEIESLGKIRRDQKRGAPRQCQANLPLYARTSSDGSYKVRFAALSPSDKDIDLFLNQLGKKIDHPDLIKRFMPFDPNVISTAAWLSAGDLNVLLGADLETVVANDRGWNAVIASREKPEGQASLIKVPHHGSSNGHHPSVWSEMLINKPTALIAPYNKGVGVPTADDAKRITGLTSDAYITNQSPFRKKKDATPMLQKSLEAGGITIRAVNQLVGGVSVRAIVGSGNEWEPRLFGGASRLSEFVARS